MSQEELASILAGIDDKDLFVSAWCAWKAQNGGAYAAIKYISLPVGLFSSQDEFPLGVYPWLLETLINECLASRKNSRNNISYEVRNYLFLVHMTKFLSLWEDDQAADFLANNDVFYEVHRSSQRQFEWRRGYFNFPKFYRAHFLYGTLDAASYFWAETGLSVSEFMEVGYDLFCGAAWSPERLRSAELSRSSDLTEKVLSRISVSHTEARRIAERESQSDKLVAYRKSLLRDFPIIRFGEDESCLISPLPELILNRITSGIYLDVVGGNGSVNDEIGKKFEAYCLKYLSSMMGDYTVCPEYRYGLKGKQCDTPDILIREDGVVALAVECKAKSMTFEAKFSDDPVDEARRGYCEIAKGIFQIWRFFSHIRRGKLEENVSPDAVGIVLTAYPWMVLGKALDDEIYSMAEKFCLEKDPDISDEDKRRIPIVFIDDVEYVLQRCDGHEFVRVAREIASEKSGWMRSIAYLAELGPVKPYPFSDELLTELPWLKS